MTSDFATGRAGVPARMGALETRGASIVPDDVSQLDRVLMGELSTLNYHLAQYVLRFFEADAGGADRTSPKDDEVLADRLAAAGDAIRTRAQRRWRQEEAAPTATEGM